jgi:hypothetical protein
VVLILNKDAMKKTFPSTRVTLSFSEKTISVNKSDVLMKKNLRPFFRENDALDENRAWKG